MSETKGMVINMETIYITTENGTLRCESEHLKLTKRGKLVQCIPLVGVKSLVILNSTNLTFPAIDLLLNRGIDIIYTSKSGNVKGRIISAKGGGAIVRLAQHSNFLDYQRRLLIAKKFVAGKINNQMALIKKYKYYEKNHSFDAYFLDIQRFLVSLEKAESIDTIMGIEGIAAKYYWAHFGALLKNPVFIRRDYRPAPDYVNGLLNLAYTFLANELTTCLLAEHFDLELGFLHSVHYGRNSLVLDMMEEFRAPFADAIVLVLLNKNILQEKHFETIRSDFRLNSEGFSKFCMYYHNQVTDWQEIFRVQVKRLKKALIEGSNYEPYRQ
ncbi:CRISPR-associated endonuclease Cas1 [Acetobacterium wieringae]|uniref:CRISPR-associated endonuclease Cas1 n=1 Tax=Acetobacterium wieringae TaxID=52694 RepID=A0ABY6HAU9_9FIRM|nr:CRISPR-associated endonuclease Cas1 [Acetobacterium wieringae]UYO61627.1 CRISPR-associated endonuclease Cas1 [Acetobacterium wieringae]